MTHHSNASTTHTHRAAERGSVIMLIFICVILFAALSFAVSNIMRSGDPRIISQERSKMAAGEILDMARSLRQAVQELRINGCSDTQISFEGLDSQYTGYYENPNAPADESCHLFRAAGMGMTHPRAAHDWLFTPYDNNFSGVEFNGQLRVEGLGTNATELILWVFNLNQGICEQLNQRLDLPADNTETLAVFSGEFKGSYSALANHIGDDAGSIFTGQPAGCIYDPNNASGHHYHFYQVMIIR